MAVASTAFTDAVRDFTSQSTKKKIPRFINHVFAGGQAVTAEEVQADILSLERDNSQRASRRLLRPVFEAVLDYDGVIGTLSNLPAKHR
jgi:hypothetical protein